MEWNRQDSKYRRVCKSLLLLCRLQSLLAESLPPKRPHPPEEERSPLPTRTEVAVVTRTKADAEELVAVEEMATVEDDAAEDKYELGKSFCCVSAS
jgi:hypothetical protein